MRANRQGLYVAGFVRAWKNGSLSRSPNVLSHRPFTRWPGEDAAVRRDEQFLDLGRRPVLVEQSREERSEHVPGLNRLEFPGAVGTDLGRISYWIIGHFSDSRVRRSIQHLERGKMDEAAVLLTENCRAGDQAQRHTASRSQDTRPG